MINNFNSLTYTEIIEKTADYVKSELKEAEGGHDWYHIERVWKNAVFIAKKENKGDMLVIELAALLHDIADAKFHNGDESIGPRLANEFLSSLEIPEETIAHVIKIVENISFRKRHLNSTFNSVELQIVQDADRLDAIGAIGIARVFNFGGYMNRRLYDPVEFEGTEIISDGQNNRHTIGHFYDKLLLLSKMMNTETGRKIAKERHDFMETFLKQFYKEWEGLI